MERSATKKGTREVEITPFKDGAEGAFCLSIDFELAWGKRFLTCFPFIATLFAQLGRKNFAHIIGIFKKYSIPVTWAVVGHLFLFKCYRDKTTGLAHPEMCRPRFHKNKHWVYFKGDWYQHDPCTSVRDDPWWYAADLILQISTLDGQEIATHSFSHIDFSNANEEVARAELYRCRSLSTDKGLNLKSMVYPGNLVGHLDILPETGIIAYRGSDNGEYTLGYPKKVRHGVWEIQQTMQLSKGRESSQTTFALKMIDIAMSTSTVLHIWFHDCDLDKKSVKLTLEPILEYVNRMRLSGRLWVTTMGELASYCEAREKAKIDTQQCSDKTYINVSFDNINYEKYSGSEITLKIPRKNGPIIINKEPLHTFPYIAKGNYIYINIPVSKLCEKG